MTDWERNIWWATAAAAVLFVASVAVMVNVRPRPEPMPEDVVTLPQDSWCRTFDRSDRGPFVAPDKARSIHTLSGESIHVLLAEGTKVVCWSDDGTRVKEMSIR